jgi:hypothetical protein
MVMPAKLICIWCVAQEDALIEKLRTDLAEHVCVWTGPQISGAVFELRPPPVGLYQCAPLHALSPLLLLGCRPRLQLYPLHIYMRTHVPFS